MKTILVQMSDRQWTMQAVHLACALARNYRARVVLLRLMPVRHPGYLGTEFGDAPPTPQEYAEMDDYNTTAEDYGVEMLLQPMQCLSSLVGLVDAADQLDAEIVFAHIPESRIPYWSKFQQWNLERRLKAAHRTVFVQPKTTSGAAEMPSITVRPAPDAASSAAVKRQVS